jgi:acetyl-CoA carboxylase carboxyltransferase component
LVSDGEHYGLSKKTKHRKGEQMKRLALLSVVSLMLASTVFAPVALAQEPAEVDVQSVTLGPGGSVTIIGTIECLEGYFYSADVTVRQRTGGNVYNTVSLGAFDTCANTGTQTITVTGFSNRPFHRGPATIEPRGTLHPPDFSTPIDWHGAVEAVHIR